MVSHRIKTFEKSGAYSANEEALRGKVIFDSLIQAGFRIYHLTDRRCQAIFPNIRSDITNRLPHTDYNYFDHCYILSIPGVDTDILMAQPYTDLIDKQLDAAMRENNVSRIRFPPEYSFWLNTRTFADFYFRNINPIDSIEIIATLREFEKIVDAL